MFCRGPTGRTSLCVGGTDSRPTRYQQLVLAGAFRRGIGVWPADPSMPTGLSSRLFLLAGVPCTRAPFSSVSGSRRCRTALAPPAHSPPARVVAASVRLRPWWPRKNHPTFAMTVSRESRCHCLSDRLEILEIEWGPAKARARVRGLAPTPTMNGCGA